MRNPKKFSAVFLFVVLPLVMSPALGQGEETRLEVFVSQPRPAADELIELTYTFSGGGLGAVRLQGTLPLKNLDIVWGPATSNRVEFINLEVRRSMSVTYRLRPQKQGPAEIGETSWSVGDRTLKGHPYALEVGPARNLGPGPGGAPGARPRQPGGTEEDEDPFPSPFRWAEPRGIQRTATRQRDALVSYIVTADRTSAYAGEEIVLHYELITQADISGLDFVEPPKFPGFWAEDLERPERPQGRQDVYEGRTVTRFTLLKKAISGLSAGTFTIPPATVKLAVRLPGDPFVDPFSFMRPQIVERSTKPLEVKILPIPGNPNFRGPVGNFSIGSTVDRKKVAVGEAITVKVKITGSGNLRTATEAPRLEIANAQVYPPTPKSTNSRANGRTMAASEWEYVVVPGSPGELTIPPVSVAVFDPAVRKIVERTSLPHTVTVSEASGTVASAPGHQTSPTPVTSAAEASAAEASAAEASAAEASAAETTAATEMPAKAPPLAQAAGTGGRANPKSTPVAQIDLENKTVTIPLWLLIASPVFLLGAGGAVFAVHRHRKNQSDRNPSLQAEPGETKERAASRFDRAVRVQLARKFAISDVAQPGAILEAMEAAGAEEELREEVRILFADLEFLRFAPQLGEYAEKVEETRQRALRVSARLK